MIDERVKRNHNRLINSIDIERYFNENFTNNYQQSVINLCEQICSLEIPYDTKYVLALENICYLYDKTYKSYDVDILIENITEFFLYNNLYDNIYELESVLEKVSLKKPANINKAKEILSKFPMDKIKTKAHVRKVLSKLFSVSKNNIIDETPNWLAWIRKGLIVGSLFLTNPYLGAVGLIVDYFLSMTIKRDDVKRMLKEMNKEKNKVEKKIDTLKDGKVKKSYEQYLKELKQNIDKIEDYERNLYSERENEERDNMNENSMLNYSFSTEEYLEKYHKLFVEQVTIVRESLENFSKNIYKEYFDKNVLLTTSKDELDQFSRINENTISNYIDADNNIQFCVGQLLPYNLKNYNESDEFNEKTKNLLSSITEKLSLKVDDMVNVYFDGDSDINNLYVNLSVPINNVNENRLDIETKKDLAMILTLEEEVNKINNIDTESLFLFNENNYDKLNESYINFLLEFNNSYELYNKEDIKENLLEAKNFIYKDNDNLKKYEIGSIIENGVYNLYNSNYTKNKYQNRYQTLSECMMINENMEILNELSGLNRVKLSKEKLVKNMQKLRDKDRMMSQRMDNALDKFYNKVEKELTNRNREKVIKGTILPSASTIVKIAVTSGIVGLFNPALAVIGVLGSLAISKRATHKEKQYILDEINIMLQMTEKKIQLAENNNDMKAMEELLRTKQKLEREKQRIYYNLKRRNHTVIVRKED